jgi:phenylacetate-coenzyme A ligase PaaK-like adenylate-forming protein
VRVCSAAAEAGLDIAGTFFSLGGEPYTEAKARVIESAGCRAESSYYVSELGGPVALGCPTSTGADRAHLAEDRLAVIRGEGPVAGGPGGALYLTTISPLAPQVAINLEVGDYAVEEPARCGCAFAQAGLSRVVHSIRSYEKLTTEGMHFVGSELVTLLEDELPRRFGGSPTDYQLVEEEDGTTGRSRLRLAVAPRVGPVDEAQVAGAALDFLRSAGSVERMMAEFWMAADTLRVVRRQPEVSEAGKVLPLHVSRAGSRH